MEGGQKKSIHATKWPQFDAQRLVDDRIKIAVQINGKTRGDVEVEAGCDKDTQESAAKDAVAARLEGKKIIRIIVVPGRLVNFVIQD